MLKWHRLSWRFSMESWSAAFFSLVMYASSSLTLSHVTCTTSPFVLLPTQSHGIQACNDTQGWEWDISNSNIVQSWARNELLSLWSSRSGLFLRNTKSYSLNTIPVPNNINRNCSKCSKRQKGQCLNNLRPICIQMSYVLQRTHTQLQWLKDPVSNFCWEPNPLTVQSCIMRCSIISSFILYYYY